MEVFIAFVGILALVGLACIALMFAFNQDLRAYWDETDE